jgi:hypothetical protein
MRAIEHTSVGVKISKVGRARWALSYTFIGAIVTEIAQWAYLDTSPGQAVSIRAISTLDHAEIKSRISITVAWTIHHT